MKNTIAERIYDFLKDFPPFEFLTKKKLMQISTEVQIIYLEKGKSLFNKNDSFHQYFYIVRDGAVGLFHTVDGIQNLVDVCDSGDIFGIRPLINKENYSLTATANEESIVYGIPIEIFELVSENSKKINKYLITSFASNSYDPYTTEQSGEIFGDYIPSNNQDLVNFQTANYTKNPITCTINSNLKEAALKMSENKIGCIVVVDNEKRPVGIITNSDIKNKIATGLFPIETSVVNIMSSPVVTFPKEITVSEGQLKMIKESIGHLCITKDGTSNSKLIGILTNHDILVTIGRNPSVMLKEIKRAKRIKTLRETRNKANILLKGYLEQNIPLSHILKIISEINDAVTVRTIELSLDKMKTSPPVNFAWIALGSQGRKEQLLYTDQDNAIIFDDVPKEIYDETQQYFLELGQLITTGLHKIGYEYCPAEMMCSNPEWCKSISEWKDQFRGWILNPDEKAILLSSIFFDYEFIYGENSIVEQLTKSIFETVNKTSIFFSFLGTDALRSPSPLGFFKNLVVEQDGEHKGLFNIKSRALMPLIDAARLLVLSKNIKNINNTSARYEKLAEIEPQNKELYESCSYAFKALLKFKTKQGLLHNDSGQFIDLESLSKEETLKLKRCFKPIRNIKELLKLRFPVSNLI
ncbi:DUF294 nucleotidyltransferase-like domain-containing protein [Urechidicola croceus]|uniref:Nucleotidyltransferase n=1 Tax=Urechidicola croceus TaxID=1850246 RepID=A0A1D8P402_9FLAO|nr:DUF294 nucleotidyltransferase-like domain-containing protein [Urechidicola croceus]AOW19277.1 nucleotidyltransferase [Urechidicola croceus]